MRETISVALLGAAVACGNADADDRTQRVELDRGAAVVVRLE